MIDSKVRLGLYGLDGKLYHVDVVPRTSVDNVQVIQYQNMSFVRKRRLPKEIVFEQVRVLHLT